MINNADGKRFFTLANTATMRFDYFGFTKEVEFVIA
jgi:hypothetical protein